MLSQIKNSAIKNWPELYAFFTGKMPQYLYGRHQFKDIPVFCLHEAKKPVIEKQFRFLSENGYRTITVSELVDRLEDPGYQNDGRDVALTFDDGLGSVWSIAYPLALRYGIRFTLFVLTGFTKDDMPGVRIDNAKNDKEFNTAIQRDNSADPFCSWSELLDMHGSGIVDIQSHGVNHARVAIAPRILDFVHPNFQTLYGNIQIPQYQKKDGQFTREPILGHPIYASDSLFSAKSRFCDSIFLRNKLSTYVSDLGGKAFFKHPDWRKKLFKLTRDYFEKESKNPNYEDISAEVTGEFVKSKKNLETRLPGKRISHFCFPWFKASINAVNTSRDCGYQYIYLGASINNKLRNAENKPLLIARVQQEYITALPGSGRSGLIEIIKAKSSRNFSRNI